MLILSKLTCQEIKPDNLLDTDKESETAQIELFFQGQAPQIQGHTPVMTQTHISKIIQVVTCSSIINPLGSSNVRRTKVRLQNVGTATPIISEISSGNTQRSSMPKV